VLYALGNKLEITGSLSSVAIRPIWHLWPFLYRQEKLLGRQSINRSTVLYKW